MELYFITGNKNKFSEANSVILYLKQLDINLPEIQDIDARKIIHSKLIEALNHRKSDLVVEDTSLYMNCLNGLPGPLIKWFLETIGNQGLYNIAKSLGNTSATAKTIIGYAKSPEEIYFFEGAIEGEIVQPRGNTNFGWDPIFKPKNFDQTFAEMSQQEKNKISMRKIAFSRLRKFLEN